MRVKMDMNVDAFVEHCQAAVSKVGRATKKATVACCEEIIEESLKQVPRDTDALAQSAFYDIHGSYKDFSATVGYGGNGNPVNPKTGRRASEYAAAVHEDLYAHHTIGKAKFLEDPIREFAQENFPRTIIKYVKPALEGGV